MGIRVLSFYTLVLVLVFKLEGILSKSNLFSVYEAIASEALGRSKSIRSEENVLLIQPYIKWGPNKSNVSPDIKLQEAEDLIKSLDTWNISDSVKVPMVGFGKHTFFGRGKIDELRRMVVKYNGDHLKKVGHF